MLLSKEEGGYWFEKCEISRVSCDETGFEPQLYAVEWFSALFTISTPRALSLALLDLVFARFDEAFHKTFDPSPLFDLKATLR